MRWKRNLAVMTAMMAAVPILSCSQKKDETVQEKASVYIQCYSEVARDQWNGIAGTYRTEHGISVRVLDSKDLAKEEREPTIIVLEKASDYEKWRNQCMDLSGTRIYSWLLDQKMAQKERESVTALPCGIRGLGIVYNETMADRYFDLTDRATGFESMDEIKNFQDLKAMVQDMTKNKDRLRYSGVFASPYFKDVDNGWQTELLDMAVSLELKEKGEGDASQAEFLLSDSVRNIVDLYFENSVTGQNSLWRRSEEDALQEFAEGRAVMMQGDDQTYRKINELPENTVSKKEIRYLPLYLGLSEQEELYLEADDYLCVNAEASVSNKKAAVTFLEWLYETDQGKSYVTEEMGYTAPYVTFSEEDIPSDPLAWDMITETEKGTVNFVNWSGSVYETKEDAEIFMRNLSEYARTLKTWDEVSDGIREDLKIPKKENQ